MNETRAQLLRRAGWLSIGLAAFVLVTLRRAILGSHARRLVFYLGRRKSKHGGWFVMMIVGEGLFGPCLQYAICCGSQRPPLMELWATR